MTRKRSPEWVYTYLKTFYSDPSRPLGVNNKVFPKVGMPHVLEPLQGIQRSVCKEAQVRPYATGQADPAVDQTLAENQCGFLEVVEGTGKLTPAVDVVDCDRIRSVDLRSGKLLRIRW